MNATNRAGDFRIAAQGDREIVMTRTFDAPRHLVYAALAKPELMKRWLGPRSSPMAECEIDLRAGGAYRWVWRLGSGGTMGVSGVYREIVPDERIVATEKFDEPWYPGQAIVTLALRGQGGKTRLTTTILYESLEARDGVLKTPMRHGVAESYDRLDELLALTSGASR